MPHAWELAADGGHPAPRWEIPDMADSSEDESSDDDNVTQEGAARLLIDFVLDFVFPGTLSAKSACIIFWWAGKAGVSACADRWGFRPDAPSGHYQRHLDAMLGIKLHDRDRYCVDVPAYQKHHRGRHLRRMPVQIPHEVLDAEARSDPCFIDTLTRAKDDGSLPSIITESMGGGPLASPVAIYIDGVQFIKQDSLIGIWAYHILTGIRYVCLALRKSWLCRCGCRGWCSVWIALDFVRWSLEAGVRGVYPLVGYGGEAFAGTRLATAGTHMMMQLRLCYIKGDWAEFAHTFGLPNWKTNLSPCCWCLTTVVEWLDLSDISERIDDATPWAPMTARDYDDACRACEVTVTIPTRAVHDTVIASLRYDKRQYGSRGRALVCPIPALNLESGDRLEPSPNLHDVAGFDHAREYPIVVTFWRRRRETACRHRNPLFSIPGVSIRNLMIDMLHCVYLGIAQNYISTVLWMLITSNVWHIQTGTRDELEQLAVIRLWASIEEYYAQRRPLRARPEGTTEIQDLTIGMLGSRDAKLFKAKGAETKGLIPFAISMLEKYGVPALPAAATPLIAAGKALMEVIRVQAVNECAMSPASYSYMYKCGVQHVRAAFLGGVAPLPKHHAFLHVLRDASRNGNPRHYACWLDESLNKIIGGVASKAYVSLWEARIISHMNALRDRKSIAF